MYRFSSEFALFECALVLRSNHIMQMVNTSCELARPRAPPVGDMQLGYELVLNGDWNAA